MPAPDLNIDDEPEPTATQAILDTWGRAANQDLRDINVRVWDLEQAPPAAPADASDTVKGITKLSVAPANPVNPIALGANDPQLANLPTADEKAALAGTAGAGPSAGNPYVLDDDPRLVGGGGGNYVPGIPVVSMWAIGDLTLVAGNGQDLDFFRVRIAATLIALTVTVDVTPGAGSVEVDVLKNGVTMFPVDPRPAVACNGGRATVTLTGASLDVTAIAAGDILTFRVVGAPSGARDVRVEPYLS